MQDAAQLITMVLLAAFAIERVTAAATFLAGEAGDPRGRRILLFALGAAVALAIVDWGGIRIVERLQPHRGAHFPQLDYWLTWLVVVAGADRIREFVPDGTLRPQPKTPVVKLLLDDRINAKSA